VKVASPEGLATFSKARAVGLQTADGEILVLPGHSDLVTLLVPGELLLTLEDQTEKIFAIGDGFAQVGGLAVTVMASFAEEESRIQEDEVALAKSRAEAALKGALSMSPAEIDTWEFLLKKSIVELEVKKKGGARRRAKH
jgi:F-type H+-transporting ATPase subunit epsilon